MLPKINRLVKKEDFDLVKEKGERFQGRFFGILAYKKKGDVSRFGFILSTKLSRKSTVRNRAKRILREAARRILSQTKEGYDIIFLGKKELLEKSSFEIFQETERVFKEAFLIK